jgi:hypothetical protein
MVGAGQKSSPGRALAAPIVLADYKSASEQNLPMPVSFPAGDSDTLGVYSTETMSQISIQRPLTKDDAVSEAVREVDWSLDGLQNSRNLVVQLSACAAAIPLSLWKQTVGMVRGVTRKDFESAEAQLTAASHQVQPQLELARQVALQLAPRTSQPVSLVNNPFGLNGENRSTTMTRVGALSFVNQHAGTALEIHVRSAALKGNGDVNSSLALCVEAQATLFRADDGAELYSCPVHYRSEERKFTQWAAHDAQLFRQELQRCYQDVGASIVDQLVARGLIPPDRAPHSIVAKQ